MRQLPIIPIKELFVLFEVAKGLGETYREAIAKATGQDRAGVHRRLTFLLDLDLIEVSQDGMMKPYKLTARGLLALVETVRKFNQLAKEAGIFDHGRK